MTVKEFDAESIVIPDEPFQGMNLRNAIACGMALGCDVEYGGGGHVYLHHPWFNKGAAFQNARRKSAARSLVRDLRNLRKEIIREQGKEISQ